MAFLTDLAEGFATLLAAEVTAAQNLAWSATGTYATDKTGIYMRKAPATPNRVLVLTCYGLGDDATYADSDVGLQLISRSAGQDPRDAEALDDATADVLLGRYPLTLTGGIRVETLRRSSGPTSLGQDDNQRWSLVSNYLLTVHHPATHRL